jgi:mediator of RNA polymerase II transcription subunit 21
MADRLTQLQDSMEQLFTQMFATLTYIDARHPSVSIPPQVDQHIHNTNASSDAPTTEIDPNNRHNPEPNPQVFQDTMRELARDLVVKQAQIEALIESLPGLGRSREMQEWRIEELEAELGRVEVERVEARREREALLRRVEGRIVGARRV